MELISEVTEKDIGRIFVNSDKSRKFWITSLNKYGPRRVQCWEFSFDPGRTLQRFYDDFTLISGIYPMYWEDTKAETPFEEYCRENNFDPEGKFFFKEQRNDPKKYAVFNLSEDNGTDRPLFNAYSCGSWGLNIPFEFKVLKGEHIKDYEENLKDLTTALSVTTASGHYLDSWGSLLSELRQGRTDADYRRILCDKVSLKNNPKPRFHKKRVKPPVRKKTDVVIHYYGGKEYTIKNVKSLSIYPDTITLHTSKDISGGVLLNQSIFVSTKNVYTIVIKSTDNREFIDFSNTDEDFTVSSVNSYEFTSNFYTKEFK